MSSEHGVQVCRKKWFEDHPQFKEIQAYGYFKDKPSFSRVAMLVYLDLCESKHWFDVRVHPCESLKLVYLTGKPTKKAEAEQIVPMDMATSLTMEEIHDLVSEISACEGERVGTAMDSRERSSCQASATLGFCESDSSIVYYKVFDGLVPPDPPKLDEESGEKKTKTRRRYKRKQT